MNTNDSELSKVTVTILSGSNEICIASFMMELDAPLLEILQKLRRGDPTTTSQLCSMMSSAFLKYGKEMSGVSLPEQSIGKLSSDFRYTLSLTQLLRTSWHYETLVKRLESFKLKLTPTDGSELHITSPELRQVDSLLALMTSDLVEISRILRNASVESSSPIPA